MSLFFCSPFSSLLVGRVARTTLWHPVGGGLGEEYHFQTVTAGPSGLRERNLEARRQQILEAARTLLSRRGIAALSPRKLRLLPDGTADRVQ